MPKEQRIAKVPNLTGCPIVLFHVHTPLMISKNERPSFLSGNTQYKQIESCDTVLGKVFMHSPEGHDSVPYSPADVQSATDHVVDSVGDTLLCYL